MKEEKSFQLQIRMWIKRREEIDSQGNQEKKESYKKVRSNTLRKDLTWL